MKKNILLFIVSICFLTACQKNVSVNNTPHLQNDTLTYEIITTDTGGWYGVWMDENGELAGTGLDGGNSGSAIYFKSGWKYSFVAKNAPFQMMMSVDSKNYDDNITINFYKNGVLQKTQTSEPFKGFAKMLWNAVDGSIVGTTQDPIITYEVLLDNMDTTKFQSNGWSGQWYGVKEHNTSVDNPLTFDFAIPGGWRNSFHPKSLPFTMSMQTMPYTKYGAEVTINFYVNGVLVKTTTSNDLIYPPLTFEVL